MRVQESAHVAMMHTGARSTAGTTALLGTAPSKAELVSHALLDSPHTLDVALEVHNFGFNEAEALVTRSQLEGASLLLPARFRQVCSARARRCRRSPCSLTRKLAGCARLCILHTANAPDLTRSSFHLARSKV